jgi:hypothetical protein
MRCCDVSMKREWHLLGYVHHADDDQWQSFTTKLELSISQSRCLGVEKKEAYVEGSDVIRIRLALADLRAVTVLESQVRARVQQARTIRRRRTLRHAQHPKHTDLNTSLWKTLERSRPLARTSRMSAPDPFRGDQAMRWWRYADMVSAVPLSHLGLPGLSSMSRSRLETSRTRCATSRACPGHYRVPASSFNHHGGP